MAVAYPALGGWVVFADRADSMPEPVIASLVQGATSAVSTFFLRRAIEMMVLRLAMISTLILLLVAISASLTPVEIFHTVAGTPEIHPRLQFR